MHPLDITIIVLYLILMALVGWWVAKKASKNAESYFLASKSLPWWIIGVAQLVRYSRVFRKWKWLQKVSKLQAAGPLDGGELDFRPRLRALFA